MAVFLHALRCPGVHLSEGPGVDDAAAAAPLPLEPAHKGERLVGLLGGGRVAVGGGSSLVLALHRFSSTKQNYNITQEICMYTVQSVYSLHECKIVHISCAY